MKLCMENRFLSPSVQKQWSCIIILFLDVIYVFIIEHTCSLHMRFVYVHCIYTLVLKWMTNKWCQYQDLHEVSQRTFSYTFRCYSYSQKNIFLSNVVLVLTSKLYLLYALDVVLGPPSYQRTSIGAFEFFCWFGDYWVIFTNYISWKCTFGEKKQF